MCPDFIQHQERDPDRSTAEALALGMQTSHTKYGQAKRTLHKHGLLIKRKVTVIFNEELESKHRKPNYTVI